MTMTTRTKAGTLEGLDGSARYHDGRGIALRIAGWAQRWEPCIGFYTDENGAECEEEIPGDGEWVDDLESDRVVVVMVGDDRETTIDLSGLTLLAEEDYCGECGQVGCAHDGRDRGAS
jgi:hypothetical protein